MERAGAYRGRYHVLGGLLSALDGVGPEALRVAPLVARARDGRVREVILALPATVDGQTTAHYLADRLAGAAGLGHHAWPAACRSAATSTGSTTAPSPRPCGRAGRLSRNLLAAPRHGGSP